MFGFKFSSLQQRYFRFILPTVSAAYLGAPHASNAFASSRERARVNKFLRAGTIGLRAMEEARRIQRSEWQPVLRQWARTHKQNLLAQNRVGTGSTGSYLSYAPLMKRVETALRHVEERWRG